jgi:periplasmic divalent cation tolerance protein
MTNAIVVFVTAANHAEAEKIARVLVERRVAACAQILPPIVSIYRWQNQIEQSAEVLLLAKTMSDRFDLLAAAVRENHSYEVPEIVAVPAEQVSFPYLQWLQENTAL